MTTDCRESTWTKEQLDWLRGLLDEAEENGLERESAEQSLQSWEFPAPSWTQETLLTPVASDLLQRTGNLG